MDNCELVFIFAFCAASVQIFMAYNGGATQGSIDDIQLVSHWSEYEIGILGSMDKIGMTVSSTFWGVLLSKYEAKPLLVMGLGVNWLATLLFSVLTNHWSMQIMKLLMGFTEGLQWVWSQSWIMKKTEGNSLNIAFVSISSGSAALGNLLGTIIAGYSTGSGLTYQFAFKIEAVGLVISWIVLLVIHSEKMTIDKDSPDLKSRGSSMSGTSSMGSASSRISVLEPMLDGRLQGISFAEGVRTLTRNKVFRFAALGYATTTYVAAAFAFQWIRLFMGLWVISKDEATTSLIFFPTLAGASGMFFGAWFVIGTVEERRRTLRCLNVTLSLSFIFAVLTAVGLFLQVRLRLQQAVEGVPDEMAMTSDAIFNLGVTFFCVSLSILFAACSQAALNGISTSARVIGDDLQPLAVGVQQCCTNCVGFAMGPFLPQLMMSVIAYCYELPERDFRIVFVGGACALAGTFPALLFNMLACKAAHQPVM